MLDDLASKTIVIAGGSGFVGTSLAQYLTGRGASVAILSRSTPVTSAMCRHFRWDGRTLGDWTPALEQADALINLAGRSVNCVKTPDHRDEILRSRIESTRVLGQALRSLEAPPRVWIQMSTAHIYGDPPSAVCTENSPFGYGLAPFVGKAWEAAFHESVLPDQRWVVLRTSFVLGRNRGAGGSALETLKRVTRFGLGGRVGSGRQGISWIHEHDMHRLFEWALVNPATAGAYIASSPNPVPQTEFMRELRRALKVPIGLPAPAWMVRLGGPLVLRTDPELALYGRYVHSDRLAAEGFEFEFTDLTNALRDLCHRRPRELRSDAFAPEPEPA